jgi:hypothetical protein
MVLPVFPVEERKILRGKEKEKRPANPSFGKKPQWP